MAGMLLMTSGCATTEGRLITAATVKGRSEAKIIVPDLPAECQEHMKRVVPKQGDKARWLQARWEANADVIDRQVDDCAAFHVDFKHRLEKQGH
jgi:hypothetical protein